MSLESFYGGKQGVSPVVKARFKYIDTNDPAYISYKNNNGQVPDESEVMELCFSNTAYDTVWYGQLAIIDTTNKRNKNNGKLFRRVLGRSDDETKKDGGTPHAEYIGRIVGPSEGFPKVQFSGSIDSLKQQVKDVYINSSENKTDNDFTYPIGENTISNDVQNENSFNNIYEFTATVNNNQLVPGVKKLTKDENGKWKTPENADLEKGIHYSWTNIRKNIDGETEDTYVYLGFEIPFTVFAFDFKGVDWNENFEYNWSNETNYLNGNEPFYQHWEIEIPRGITGNHSGYLRRAKFGDFKNLKPSENKDILYKFEDVFSENDGSFIVPVYGTSNKSYPYIDELNSNSSILVYTFFINRINSQNEEKEVIPITCYIGAINDIEKIELQDNGEIFVTYSDGKAAISINKNNKIKWIDSIVYQNNQGYDNNYNIIVNYNTGDSKSFFVPYIKNVYVSTDNGKYQFNYNYVKTDGSTMTQYFSNGGTTSEAFKFSFVDDFQVDDKTKELTYRKQPIENGKEYKQFSSPVYLNSIEDVYLGKNGHLFVKYSSSAKRYNGTGENNSDPTWAPYPLYWHVDSNNRTWYQGGDLPGAQNEPTDVWWEDLGLILQNKIGGLVREEFNKNRYIAYAKVANLPEEKIPDWDSIESNQLLTILKASWTINGIEYNPYINGHIYEYRQPALGEKNIEEWVTEGHTYQEFLNSPKVNGVDGMGQLIYFRNGLYFFDNVESAWKFAGSWNSTDAINKMQIVIQTDRDSTKILPKDRTIDEYGFSLLNNDLPAQQNEMPDLFNLVGD